MAAVTQAVLTHEEIAQIIMFTAMNNMLTVSVGGRTFWAIPSLVSSTVVVPAPSSTSSSAAVSGSAMIIIILIAVLVGIVMTVILVMFVQRRRNAYLQKNPNSISRVSPWILFYFTGGWGVISKNERFF